MKAEALHWAGSLLTLAFHHPLPALAVAGIVVFLLVKSRLFSSVTVPETTVISGDGFAVGVLLTGALCFVLFGVSSSPHAKLHRVRPVINHITHITHVTHVTQAAAHGTSGWLIAFIAAVIVAVVIWIFRKLIGR